ncbi:ATP-binding protein [Azospirillum sp. TSA2s]|uniref:ATP-binding protein n=1 Tax=Azospirillum sp. TSA2s TaxID=709810 RepID=UPI001FFE5C7E|nr:ATP-binding protein [Azospirillum sp. TSA2s]
MTDLAGFWRHTPRLTVLAVAVLLITGGLMALASERAYREERAGDVEVQARILAATVTAALSFNDRTAAGEYVAALSASPEFEAAGVYDGNGAIFATHTAGGMQPMLAFAEPPGRHFDGGHLTVTVPVMQDGRAIGSVSLRTQVEPFARRAERYVGMALLLAMTVLMVLVLGAAQAALARANRDLAERARDLSTANEALNAEIAECEKVEAALRQSQKMEAMGQLTGGIAHDFNNLLQALAGCLQLVGRRAKEPSIQPLLETGQQAIDRGAKLVQQLMAFARRQTLRPEPMDVRDRLLGMADLLTRAIRADITLETELEPGLWPVEVDPTQFELAILNLAVNARDAMPEGGQLHITARNRPAGDAGIEGDLVQVTVSDTGTGMEPEVKARVFEPFFTTKEVGKGSGLGLAQVYGFTRQSSGRVEIDSAPGRGTAVSLFLPRTAKPVAAPAAERALDTGCGGDRHLLLVEDDPIVGSMVAAALEEIGYAVLRAANAEEALGLLTDGDLRIDILFSDVVMPGPMNGVDLAHAARRLRPGLPVVLTTGYSEDVARIEGVRVLPKPYRVGALAELLDAVLAAEGDLTLTR